jgi:hypothetical protein
VLYTAENSIKSRDPKLEKSAVVNPALFENP